MGLVLVGCAGAAWAGDEDCPAAAAPEIEVVPSFQEPKFDHSMTFREIEEARAATPFAEETPLTGLETLRVGGIAAMHPVVTNSATLNLRTIENGTACAQITKVVVSVAITNSTLHIAKEFPESSCAYQSVLGHQLKHVAMARRVLKDAVPVAKDYVQQYMAQYAAIRVGNDPTGERAKGVITWSMNQYMNGFQADLLRSLRVAASRVDTPEESQRLMESCQGEVQSLLSNASDKRVP
jgi:hypothetical protein